MTLLDEHLPSAQISRPTQFQTLTVVSGVLACICLMWGLVDDRMVDGAVAWMKPFKFSLSFFVLFATLSLVETRLSEPLRTGWLLQVTGWVMATAFLAEMAYILFQGAQAEASHFNRSTPFNAFMYTVVMASGAVALISAVGLIGWLVKRDQESELTPVLRESIWLGFFLSFFLTLIVASYLSSQEGLFVGAHPPEAPTLPLLGWSGVTGDLRPAHFFSLHAMQVLPLLGLLLEKRSKSNSVWTVRVAALGYSILTLMVFALAIAGLPLVPMG